MRSTLEELQSSLVLPGDKTTQAKWKSCQTVLWEGALLASRPGLAPNTPQWTYRVSRGSPPHLEAAMRAQKKTPGGMFRPKGMKGLLMWDPRFPRVAVGSLPRGETPQNHRDQTNANVLLHSSLLSKLSDHLLLRLNHLYNRKTANGQRRFGANRRTHTDEGTLTLQN